LRVKVVVTGMVQGVGFRPFIYRLAAANHLVGYIRNRGDAGVEIVVAGRDEQVQHFLRSLKEETPALAQIDEVALTPADDTEPFTTFSIRSSVRGGGVSGSVIPYDVATCDACLTELRDPTNRRHHYFFITCTQCGPRYTVIEGLPYDRPNTTLKDFPMCDACRGEYLDPLNRRFHAQTIACATCGPQARLTTATGEPMVVENPIGQAGKLVEEGSLVAVKGNGGFHIVTSSLNVQPILRLRRVKHRSHKPFAVMGRSLDAVKSFAEVSTMEERLLTSCVRPILLLRKRADFPLSEWISPGLHTVGVMLPYTGLHHILFDSVEEPAFIMTSANPPNEPIVIQNHEAIAKLGHIVDYFLLHNRVIAQRCDDSVVRVNAGRASILRRSRGYAPAPIPLRGHAGDSLGVGAEENVTACLLLDDKAFLTPYIGDVDRVDTFAFLREATEHLLTLTQGRIAVVGCDLHPYFLTRTLADDYGRGYACPVVPVQHHYAHMLSLMGESGLEEVIGIVCDGAGYGVDGNIWGGEVLHCTVDGFSRVGHLQNHPLVGGDLAARFPLRMAAGILHGEPAVDEWLASQATHFPHGEREVNVVLKQLTRGGLPLTSSCGRVLDAVSALLGVCVERTYAGEPAMKLEAVATAGEDVLRLPPTIQGNVVDTTALVRAIFDVRDRYSVADLACSAETYVANALASIAIEAAQRRHVQCIGFSGGVAYNAHITAVIEAAIRDRGLTMILHKNVPPGDGGISLGQALGALRAL
jgi:hydrogenase maturation protein HypF